jgi:hypothetical protein
MWGTNRGSRYALPFRVIPDLGQVSEYVSHSGRSETWDVFHKHDPGSYVANDSEELGPQPSGVVLCSSFTSERNRLAREPSDDGIAVGKIGGVNIVYVLPFGDVGPVFG